MTTAIIAIRTTTTTTTSIRQVAHAQLAALELISPLLSSYYNSTPINSIHTQTHTNYRRVAHAQLAALEQSLTATREESAEYARELGERANALESAKNELKGRVRTTGAQLAAERAGSQSVRHERARVEDSLRCFLNNSSFNLPRLAARRRTGMTLRTYNLNCCPCLRTLNV
ncbi:hypothetical protein T492DRAFT_480487 [Pavlovales sp. CCMP2436]|nr:hypothetical protein T492DRAFT_480487 [Pavlovales sp. CCMP2436]